MLTTTTVRSKIHGQIAVRKIRDLAGNIKLAAADGVRLDQWREDPTLIPPVIVPNDLVGGLDEWAGALDALAISGEKLYPEDCE